MPKCAACQRVFHDSQLLGHRCPGCRPKPDVVDFNAALMLLLESSEKSLAVLRAIQTNQLTLIRLVTDLVSRKESDHARGKSENR